MAAWVVVALGVLLIALGVAVTLREPGVDWVSFCIGGSTVLNGASVARPAGRGRNALVAAALALALVGLVVAFL